MRAVPRLCVNSLEFALELREIIENLSHGSCKHLAVPNVIHLVDFVIAVDDLDWSTARCRPCIWRQATGSTLGQSQYLLY